MSISDWFKRHRWLAKERPTVGQHENKTRLNEEYGWEADTSHEPPPLSGPGSSAGLGPFDTPASNEEPPAEEVEVR